MKKKTLVVLSALFFVLVWAPAAMATSCNCAAGTCFSGGSTWPISACPECNCSASGSSAATAPLTTQFLKNNYSIPPIPGGVDYILHAKPAERAAIWKKRADYLKWLLKDASRRSEDAAVAAQAAKEKAAKFGADTVTKQNLDAEAERLQGKAEDAESIKEKLQQEIDIVTLNIAFAEDPDKVFQYLYKLSADAEEERAREEEKADRMIGLRDFDHNKRTQETIRRWFD